MTTSDKLLLTIILAIMSVLPVTAQYKLVWADEFNYEGAPDPDVWQPEKGFTRNHEDQWYQGDNAYCKGGYLIIEAKKERIKNPNYKPGSSNWKESREYAEYTSASMITRGKKSFQYGRFEMRAKIDTRSGIWPAFWTLGEKGEWPDNGEIDIMEFYRGMLLANFAWGSNERYKPIWNTNKKQISTFSDPDWSSKFHVWRMDWDENTIKIYVDDVLMASQDQAKAVNAKNKAVTPFKQPHYILLGMALGGDNGGDLSKTTFPARFEVDYVRVYQKQ